MLFSTLFISAIDTMASDSGTYTCRVVVSVVSVETDMFNYSDTSQVTLTGNVNDFSILCKHFKMHFKTQDFNFI